MKLQIVFVKSQTPVGKAISFLTEEPITHVALRLGDHVIHSALTGVEQISWADFKKRYIIIESLIIPNQPENPQGKFIEISEKYEHTLYDYGCLTWLAVRYTLKKWFGIPIPKVNLWAVSGMVTCVEFVTKAGLNQHEDSLLTPYGLYLRLKGY